MGIFDRFIKKSPKNVNESNAVFGQQQLGNLALLGKNSPFGSAQNLYVTTSAVTQAGTVIDISKVTRNSTVMSCVNLKARTIAQLPINIMVKVDGQWVDHTKKDSGASERNLGRARAVAALLNDPNKFQSRYEWLYQLIMHHELLGETFTLWWRKDNDNQDQVPLEIYQLDPTLIASAINDLRYPVYRISTPHMGFQKNEPFKYFQIMHLKDNGWQGGSGFNKVTQAVELVSLDHDIDVYANYVMTNAAKVTGVFTTEQVVPDSKWKEMANRIKEAAAKLYGSPDIPTQPGQTIFLDQGAKFNQVNMMTLQDTDTHNLKKQTIMRICALYGVPPAMIGIGDSKFNNLSMMMASFHRETIYPILVNLQEKLKQHLLKGYPEVCIQFDTSDLLKGAPMDQMQYAVAGVNAGIMTANEARCHLGMPHIMDDEHADMLHIKTAGTSGDDSMEVMPGNSPQDTGGGGGALGTPKLKAVQ